MSRRLGKTQEELAPSEERIRDLLGDSESYYVEDGEIRPTRERLSKSGGDTDERD
jgi:hypothetical protein